MDIMQMAADFAVNCEFHFGSVVPFQQNAAGRLADAHFQQDVVQFVDIRGQFSFEIRACLFCDFCFDHLIHFLSRNEKSPSLVLEIALQRPAM